jgi:5-(carboxyamino)imidazole ribonucleotide synthase
MLALAGLPLGLRFRFLEPKADASVHGLGDVVRGEYDDPAALETFAKGLDAVTFEFENVPAASVARLESRMPVFPHPDVLAIAQDRLAEKDAFRRAGIAVAPFAPVATRLELDEAVEALGFPCVLKTRRLGYDGRGQWLLQSGSDLEDAWTAAGRASLVLEAFVPFHREISVLTARTEAGETRFYPVVHNEHRRGILRVSRAPVPGISPALEGEAKAVAGRLVDELGHVGVLAVELFEVGGQLLANELAPRVHNSGHWTQDGAVTSQFENHLRAGLGLPLGATEGRGWSAMVNLVGSVPPLARLLEVPGARVHLYGKAARPGRKVGHVNLVAETPERLEELLARVEGLIEDQAAQASHRP